MHKVNTHQMRGVEPETATPCKQADDPDRWFPNGQLPDPEAVADCWSCFFQSQCAMRALTLRPKPEHGVWGGYRLAPGPGLSRSRKQLRIIAGLDIGPAASPGVEVTEELARRAEVARLSQMTDVELRAATAAALSESINGDRSKVKACEAEAGRRGKTCMEGHAYVELVWGPGVADQLQSQCCNPDGGAVDGARVDTGAEVIPLPAPTPGRHMPAPQQTPRAMAHAATG